MSDRDAASEGDVTAAFQVYRHLAMFDLVRDIRVGLNLAFYRTFAVPRIAALLQHTGEVAAHPHKRSIDTGLFMYELIEAGFDSSRGRQVVQSLNKMHRRWNIEPEDYLYVLTTFVVVPARWLASYGPRRLTDSETQAATLFYRELGRRMNIANLPSTYAEAECFFDDYEAEHVRYSDAGKNLMKATEKVMAEQLPRPLKLGAPLFTRLILDDYVARAVGLKPAPRAGRALMRLVGAIRRRRPKPPPRASGWFQPGRPVDGVYPTGYQLDELGPDSV